MAIGPPELANAGCGTVSCKYDKLQHLLAYSADGFGVTASPSEHKRTFQSPDQHRRETVRNAGLNIAAVLQVRRRRVDPTPKNKVGRMTEHIV